MPQAVVDPAELRRFAHNLKRFCAEMQIALAGLHGQYVALGDTWRDQEYDKFRQEFEQALSQHERSLFAEAEARSGRRAVLTVLLWSERHGIETYGAACRIPGLPAASRILIESALLPDLHRHVRELEHLFARPDGEPAQPAVAARSA